MSQGMFCPGRQNQKDKQKQKNRTGKKNPFLSNSPLNTYKQEKDGGHGANLV